MTPEAIGRTLGDLPKDCVGEIQWKRFPDSSSELHKLLTNGPCIIDLDTLDHDGVESCVAARMFSGISSFWVYSRTNGRVQLVVSRCKVALCALQPGSK